MQQTLLFTVLPNGVDLSGPVPRAAFSVHVGVRLIGDTAVSRFEDFEMSDWPRKDPIVGLRLVGPDGVPVEIDVTRVLRDGATARPDPALWNRLFPGDLAVKSPRPSKLHERQIRSFSAENARRIARTVYTDLAASHPAAPPSLSQVADAETTPWFGAVSMYGTNDGVTDLRDAAIASLTNAIDRGFWPGGAPSNILPRTALPHLPLVSPGSQILDPTRVALNIVQHQEFLAPRSSPGIVEKPGTDPVEQPVALPMFDFHEAVSIAGNHPTLLRRIGLIRDYVVDLGDVPWFGDAAVNCTAQLVVVELPFDQPLVTTCARTAARISTEGFLSRTDGVIEQLGFLPVGDGMVPFEDQDRFHTIEVDADGAVVKLTDFARRSFLQVNGGPDGAADRLPATSDDADGPAPVPALRSFGLSVGERNRAAILAHRFAAKAEVADALAAGNGDAVTFHLEDLTRGLRLDVWDATAGRWFSLLRRIGRYEVGTGAGTTTFETDDEGLISMAPTEGGGPAETPDLHLQETLALWSGWSLAAPQPGSPLDAQGNPAPPPGNPATSNIALSAEFRAAPGTLPRLRYGREYRFRARTVDLAGNDIGFGDPSVLGAHVTQPVRYRRFEPVAPPVVVPRAPLTSGETVRRLVIRSDVDAAAEIPNERHVAPPRTAQLVAEQHGMFDTGGSPSSAAYAGIVERDAFRLDTSPQARVDPDHPDQRYFDVDLLDVGYLPDPLAVGVVFTGLFGASGPTVVSFVDPAAPWPARRALRLRLVEGMNSPRLLTEGGAQVLEVTAPKATVVTAQVASLIPSDAGTLDLLGLWGWLAEDGADSDDLAAAILSSSHWMVTPSQELTFVHAVRRPLVVPSLTAALRRLGGAPRDGTRAHLDVRVAFDAPSTQSLELMARWSDPIDAGLPLEQLVLPPGEPNVDTAEPPVDENGGFRRIERKVRALDLGLGSGGLTAGEVVHDVGDVKHHLVDYSVVATTRFAEYFTETMSVALSGTAVPISPTGFAPGSVSVTLDTGAAVTTFTEGDDYTVDLAAGTVRRVDGAGISAGQIVEVRFVPAPVTREGPTVRIDLPASAPPARPSVLYAIPTFGWSTSGSGRYTKQSTRLGNGVRVYLDRPWWSSGDGEQLGVVLWDRPVAPGAPSPLEVPVLMEKYVTQYGEDPISGQAVHVTRALRTRDFTRATNVRTGLRPFELVASADPTATVAVAGHDVGYDPERKLWFCDIEVAAGQSYFPFLRLALARFQPSANAGCNLSSTVLADFVQLAPDRKATIALDPADPLSLRVTVTGLSFRTQVTGAGVTRDVTSIVEDRRKMAEVRVTVERHEFPAAGDAGWTPVSGLTSIPLTRIDLPFTASTSWMGALRLTSSRLSVPQRLVIEEFELRDPGTATPARVDADGNPVDGRRLVYTDIIRL